ncbi:MAG: pantetheine-phosphate adenylyltransferase [Lachnospiraceae bacterium]|nr:pantetheine-phosphate adenylyltransferase [Lachnospiraceae bacterium]MBQ9593816.1 pantetheine-phosphate adenylyltransferase [Lachnospiraceae bacterium]
MKIAIYPGSFDPVTLGHLDVIRRASRLVDKLIIGVLKNTNKHALFSEEERVSMIRMLTQDLPNVEVDSFHGLTVDYARACGARFLVRGLRAVTDFEYELQMAQTNHKVAPDIDTIFFTTSVEYAYVSSSIVKEVASYGGDIRGFVAPEIVPLVYEKYHKKNGEQ